MDFFKVVSVDEALEKMDQKFKNFNLDVEEVFLVEARGRILAMDIVSSENIPDFNRSTVDGYAVLSKNTHGASDSIPCFLNLKGEVLMGENTSLNLSDGECVYVPTGGMIPSGADAMLMIENAQKLSDDEIAVLKPVVLGENMVFEGDDIRSGELVLKKGQKLNTAQIGILAALGINKVFVYKRPSFYIISTGDEIIDIDEQMQRGQIRDINSYALVSMIENIGGTIVKRTIVKDDFNLLKSHVEEGVEKADITIISGGSSVGTKDYTCDIINSLSGEGVFVHGISIKPGKPTLIGEGMNKAIFGLPGHPVSSIIVFKSIIERFIKSKYGLIERDIFINALMNKNIHSSSGKETYQMVRLIEDDSKIYAEPVFGKSGMISLLSKSCGYIVIPKDKEGLYKDEEVRVRFI